MHTTFPPNAATKSGANGKELNGSAVNSPVIQGARPSTASSASRSARDKKDPTKEGQGKKDAVEKDEIGDGKGPTSRPGGSRGKNNNAGEVATMAKGVDVEAVGGTLTSDRVLETVPDSGILRNAQASQSERRDSNAKGDAKHPTAPGSPVKERMRQGSPMEGVEPTSTTILRKGSTAAEVEETPLPPSRKSSSASHQPPPPPIPTTASSTNKRKRGSMDQSHPRDQHGDADSHPPHSRSHHAQPSAPSRGHQQLHSSHHPQQAAKREYTSATTSTSTTHHTHHRRTSSTTTASAMQDHHPRLEPPPPPPALVPTNPIEDEEEEEDLDPNEPRYCFCNQISYGQMVACDERGCAREWFHLSCVGLTHPPKGKCEFSCLLFLPLDTA